MRLRPKLPTLPSLRVGDQSALLSVFCPVGVKVCRLHGPIFHLAWLSLAIPDSQVPAWFRNQKADLVICCESQPWDPGYLQLLLVTRVPACPWTEGLAMLPWSASCTASCHFTLTLPVPLSYWGVLPVTATAVPHPE